MLLNDARRGSPRRKRVGDRWRGEPRPSRRGKRKRRATKSRGRAKHVKAHPLVPLAEKRENLPLNRTKPVPRDRHGVHLAYQRVAKLAELPQGRGLCIKLDGIEIGLFQVGERIYAMENRCPHADDPLSEGVLDGPIVTCRAHGWQFDVRTGFRPEDADGFPIPRFSVRVRNGGIEVDLQSEPLPR